MTTDRIESYHPNNKKNEVNSSKPYSLDEKSKRNENNVESPLLNENSPLFKERSYPMESSIDIGEGMYSIVDYRIKDNLEYYSMWGKILCFTQLFIGIFLYIVCDKNSYFILTTVAIISHIFSVSLGLYAVAKKHIVLIINYTIYAVIILGCTLAVFILSAVVMSMDYPWWLFISGLLSLNLQIFGIRYLVSLFLLLKDLQKRELYISQPKLINNNPVAQYTPQPYLYPGQNYQQPQQPQQPVYYYTQTYQPQTK
ncbi:hypothetical protein DICPUDRAFT_151153 [Dictyostelium purpureum]|uniref:Transmembrane protein n=1 Tax=Dictyostelium purpureum TaxID=5786 RepID=F0ZI45_DICPU|nr:uncharacterized protein DICPUDRAFT_151153 [Dictyostelium purpureum]EGC36395.1 hypothetical protein DICPUDRAFT_151153 [Dictyostelium purpureum]|eukprot:XP_003287092.1 hypothetical protein DICPUDRAFT_151153 [Dictyostelium purpureum]